MIPYGRQDISQQDIDSVIGVLKSDFLTQGPVVPAFERALCDYTTAKRAVACNSATSALHLACRALELGPGDWLWTSPITFVASANCGLFCGASVDFVDIDTESGNMSVVQLEAKLETAKKTGQLPKILVPVHLGGNPSDMAGIRALQKKYGFRIIEDASHAIGARYKGQPIGNCRFSDITVFSFHPVKIITTGEGGAALTNRAELAEKMLLLRSHGITRNPDDMQRRNEGAWYYEQLDLGYNYRLTDLQAAIGLSQLQRLDEFIAARHQIADEYSRLLEDFPVKCPQPIPDGYSAFHLYVIRLMLTGMQNTRRAVFDNLRDLGIGVNVHYIPVHTQPFYREKGFSEGDFPNAEKYYEEIISLPMFPALSLVEVRQVVASLQSALETT